MPNEEKERFRAALNSLSDDVGGLWSPIYRQIPILERPPNASDFLRDYVSPSQPCIIRGALHDNTECASRGDGDSEEMTLSPLVLTLDDLVEHAGDCTVTVNATPDGHGDCVRKVYVSGKFEADGDDPALATSKMFVKPEQRMMTLEEFRDALRSGVNREHGRKLSFTSEQSIAEDLCSYPMHSNDTLKDTNPNQLPKNGPVLYYSQQNDCLRTELRSLFEQDLFPRSFEFAEEAFGTGPPDAVNLWVGDERAVSSMHKDHYENLFYVASGEKVFTLCPPADVPFLHVGKYKSGTFQQLAMPDKTAESSSECEMSDNSRDNNIFPRASRWVVIVDEQAGDESDVVTPAQQMVRWIEPDIERCLSRPSSEYPLLSYAHPVQVKVKAGEMLYIPSLWFHRVTQSCETVGINYWYDMKFDAKWCYFNFLQALSDPDNT